MKNLFLNQFSFHIYLIFQHWKKRMLEEVSDNKIQVRFWVFQLPLGSGSPSFPSSFFFFFVVFVIYKHNFFASLHLFFKVLWSYEVSDNNFTTWEVSKCGLFFGPYFPAFELITEIYAVYRKIRTRINSIFGHFSHSVYGVEEKIKKCFGIISEQFSASFANKLKSVTYPKKMKL